MAAARVRRAKRPPILPSRQYFLDAIIGTSSTIAQAATASHAALDRDSTRAAPRTAPPREPSRAPNGRRAVTVHQASDGNPITAMCATKFRLPNVPPGARLALKYSVSRPYACASESAAAHTAAIAAATRIGRYEPRSATDRAPQKTTAPEMLMATERCAAQWFVAKIAEATLQSRNKAIRPSTKSKTSDRRRAMSINAMMSAAMCSTSSFGTKYRSSSNTLYGRAATTARIIPACMTSLITRSVTREICFAQGYMKKVPLGSSGAFFNMFSISSGADDRASGVVAGLGRLRPADPSTAPEQRAEHTSRYSARAVDGSAGR